MGFAAMGLTSAIAALISQLMIRTSVSSELRGELAGIWQADWKISELYLPLITSTLSLHYLPRLRYRSGPASSPLGPWLSLAGQLRVVKSSGQSANGSASAAFGSRLTVR